MTTIKASATPAQRILNIVKLQFANPWTTLILPWIILGLIFIANLAIWWIILTNVSEADRADVAEGLQFSGAGFYIFVYMMVVAVQSINITFPLALGYGVTRRDYYLGASLSFVILSAIYAAGLTVLSAIEEATHGWGLGGRMFTSIYFGDGGWPSRLFIFFATFLFFFFVGAAVATVWVRWKANGITAFFVALGVLLIGAAALLTFTGGWDPAGDFFVSMGFVGSFACSLVITAIAGVTGFFILRRATPKS